MDKRLLEVKDLKVQFVLGRGVFSSLLGNQPRVVKAVDGINLTIEKGEIVGLAGESGSGKTTTGMTLVRLYKPTSGEIIFEGRDVATLDGPDLKRFRKDAQIIFQNPYESLNPRFTAFNSVVELLRIHDIAEKSEEKERVSQLLVQAGLKPPKAYFDKRPHELSGGELQRVAIARAMAPNPRFLVADEPVAMLDVSIRAGILNLLTSLASEISLSVLYISHDLSSIAYICDQVAVMYLGVIVEVGRTEAVIHKPLHPYTQSLVSSIPVADPDVKRDRELTVLEVASSIDLPTGCRYAQRCHFVMDQCIELEPELLEVEPGRWAACYLYE